MRSQQNIKGFWFLQGHLHCTEGQLRSDCIYREELFSGTELKKGQPDIDTYVDIAFCITAVCKFSR